MCWFLLVGVTLALPFQVGFLVLYLWSLLLFLCELALPPLASLGASQTIPCLSQRWSCESPYSQHSLYDANVCVSYYYTIILDFLCMGMLPGCPSTVYSGVLSLGERRRGVGAAWLGAMSRRRQGAMATVTLGPGCSLSEQN